MTQLYILRHGIAAERGAPGYARDSDRPLTPEGREKLKQVTRAMQAMGLEFDLILTSPFRRARETAEQVAEALKAAKKLQRCDHLAVGGDRRALIAHLNTLQPQPERVLLVGHEPYLSSLVSLLVAGGPQLCMDFKKAGLCRLTVIGLKAGRCATLDWLLTPKLMASMQ